MLTADQRKIFEKTIKKRELASFGRKSSLGEINDNRWLDWHKGHKHVQVKVSGRGRKGDESVANVLVDDQSPVYALDKGDPNYDSTEDAEKTVFREKTLIQGSEAYDRVKAYKMASEATIEEYFDSNDMQARLGYD